MQQLCDTYEIEFIENYNVFLLAWGELPKSYYTKDKVHLNNLGTKKLLLSIDKVHHTTKQVEISLYICFCLFDLILYVPSTLFFL